MKIDAEKFIDHMNQLQKLKFQQGLERACIKVENTAKEKCPVDSGQLRNSIHHKVNDSYGEVGSNVEYAPYVEYGTGAFSSQGNGRSTPWAYEDSKGQWHKTAGQKPQPYLMPALDENRGQIQQELLKDIREIYGNG